MGAVLLMSAAAFGAIFALSVAAVLNGLHSVSEGHVGVYWRGGALLSDDAVTEPGFHLKLPFFTTFEEVQITVQTDSVVNIPCGTSGGVVTTFGKVEVVNRLRRKFVHATIKNYTTAYDKTWIFDKIHHEINQFCSSHTLQEVYITLFDTLDESLQVALQKDCNVWAPGIEIIAVRVTKPRIPSSIEQNYELMEAEKTKLLIANEEQKVVEKQAHTERLAATIAAKKTAEVSAIYSSQQLAEKEAQQKMEVIADTIHLNHEKVLADAEHYRAIKEAEANEQRLTPAFLEYVHILALSNNTKVYFGDKLPNMMIEKGARRP